MTLQTIEDKIKTLAAKIEVDFETAVKYLHNQVDNLILGAEHDAKALKEHVEAVAAKGVADASAQVAHVETEVKTDVAKIESEVSADIAKA